MQFSITENLSSDPANQSSYFADPASFLLGILSAKPDPEPDGGNIKTLAAYLQRIGYNGDVKCDLETLTQVHRLHLLNIPYENVDVQLQHPLDLDIDRIYEKIVISRRGGWCYEMNGLLEWVLQEIGFEVKRVNGGVARSIRGDASMGNHLVLLVRLDQTYIADVGFGDGSFDPFPLTEGPFEQRGFNFRLEILADGYWRFHNHENGGAPSFDFKEDPADEQLFADQCQYLQTSEESPFVMAFIAQQCVSSGYEVQLGRLARTIRPGGVEDRVLETEAEFVERMQGTFRLNIPEVSKLWSGILDRHEEIFSDKDL